MTLRPFRGEEFHLCLGGVGKIGLEVLFFAVKDANSCKHEELSNLTH